VKKVCKFLIKYKEIEILGKKRSVIYKCELGNTLLKSDDLKEKWACNGCLIPWFLSKHHCKYIKPHKSFLIRGSSQTWFSCDLLDVVMDLPDFCHFNCILYEQD
jgi:hypothetical protein